ncbi:HU family DNA-binding protein, partial [Candidatus Neptunochlamydia vexilliferae]|uniref:HU family DNA-binding protein n=1 Tax=Candidatus Neptunichlamydia vexilliferae TaxID=1651774 RepID=UPI001E4F5836
NSSLERKSEIKENLGESYLENRFFLYENLTARNPQKLLIQKIAREAALDPKIVQIIVQELLNCVTESLSNEDRLEFRDFGVFETIIRKQKIGRNPKKADIPIVIPQKRAVKFIPGKKVKEKVMSS